MKVTAFDLSNWEPVIIQLSDQYDYSRATAEPLKVGFWQKLMNVW